MLKSLSDRDLFRTCFLPAGPHRTGWPPSLMQWPLHVTFTEGPLGIPWEYHICNMAPNWERLIWSNWDSGKENCTVRTQIHLDPPKLFSFLLGKAYWKCLGLPPDSALREPHTVLGVKVGLATGKAKVLWLATDFWHMPITNSVEEEPLSHTLKTRSTISKSYLIQKLMRSLLTMRKFEL